MILRIMNKPPEVSMKNLFKLIDYNKIIAQIEESRKGAVMIVIFICLCCAAIDYIFRKHGIIEDWFTQSYLIIGFFSTCIWTVKTYNSIADEIEKKQTQQQKQEETKEKLLRDYELLKPVFDSFQDNKIVVLRDFVYKKTTKITIRQIFENDMSHYITSINSYIYSFGYHIEQVNLGNFVIAEITPEFLQILELYFSEGLEK